MRILIAVHHFPPKYRGGAEWRAYRTASALLERGHEVRVISVERIDSDPAAGVTWQDEIFDGVPIRRLSFNLFSNPDPFLIQYKNPYIAEHLERLLGEFRPDIFHLIGGYLMSGSVLETARQAGIPCLVSLTDYWFICPRISMLRSDNSVCPLPVHAETCARCIGEEKRRFRLPGKVAPEVMKWFWRRQTGRIQQIHERYTYLMDVLNRADRIISPSQFLREMYIQAGIDPQRIVYLRQGTGKVDAPAQALAKTAEPRIRMGYMGQITPIKGVHVPIQAMRLRPEANASLKVYGDPRPFPKYTARLRRLAGEDARIEFCGRYRFQDIAQIYQELDVMVFPSIWYENSPNSILEAFAYRTPVIASRLGGMQELIEDGKNGLLFEPGDEADFARQIDRLLAERGLAAALQEGIGAVKSIAQEMDELLGIYNELICTP